jgi:thymidylate synthase
MNKHFTTYVSLLSAIYHHNKEKMAKADRTKVGRHSLYGVSLDLDLSGNKLPVETTRKINPNISIGEMQWFMSGSNLIKDLKSLGGGSFWDSWTYVPHESDESVKALIKNSEVKQQQEFHQNNSELVVQAEHAGIGPMYGQVLRNSSHCEVDQLANCLTQIITNPTSSRICATTWFPDLIPSSEKQKPWINVAKGEAALAPCHGSFIQFFVEDDTLSLMMVQRSADVPVGLVHNITQYGFLLNYFAHITGLKTGMLMIRLGDAHIYANQMDMASTQIYREPTAYPVITFGKDSGEVFGNLAKLCKDTPLKTHIDYINICAGYLDTINDGPIKYEISPYQSHGEIKYPVAV